MPGPPLSKGLAITNPLVLYRALVATQRIQPDEAQHRLAIHLQKLYHRLKDYEPQQNYRAQLTEIGATFEPQADAAEAIHTRPGLLARWRSQKVDADSRALTRRLTSYESAMHIDSPKGLLLYGEVGTGKSMLVDLLADSLPTRKKRRYHFNTFMLETFARLDRLRRERVLLKNNASLLVEDAQSSALLLLARDLIATSPILFLDEFQLPDRAASKILSNLFTSFFHLGGVLIATSNRMPEELSKATGMDFSAASASSHFSRVQEALFGAPVRSRSESMFSKQSDFVAFLEVLRARCETWDMNSARDWRRIEMQGTAAETAPRSDLSESVQDGLESLEELSPGNLGLGFEQSRNVDADVDENTSETNAQDKETPAHFYISPAAGAKEEDDSTEWKDAIRAAVSTASVGTAVPDPIPWMSTTLKVYGRDVSIPQVFNGVTFWTFSQLCATNLGPADYITMASNYHTFIVSDVPILSLLQKNEARRFITLLDALYEARCKLLIVRAAAGPDGLFFPSSPDSNPDRTNLAEDGTYAETFSEIYQDQTNPFRANISSYSPSASEPSYASSPLPQSDTVHGQANRSVRSILADEDSDFGPTYGGGRSWGASAGSASYAATATATHDATRDVPDFQRSAIFTGDDERFAYRRAESRLWEMCGARWWARQHEGWWRPLDEEIRHWERAAPTATFESPATVTRKETSAADGVDGGDGFDADANRAGDAPQAEPRNTATALPHDHQPHSPFRVAADPPPKIAWTHVWGLMTWGKKAGAWGRGVEGLQDRKTEGERANEDENGNEEAMSPNAKSKTGRP